MRLTPGHRDDGRGDRISAALRDAALSAVVCTRPANVLLATGYWPVLGTALALVTAAGCVYLVAPEDEQVIAARGWFDELFTFRGGSLEDLRAPADAIAPALAAMAARVPALGGALGYDAGEMFEPATYAASYRAGTSRERLLAAVFPRCPLVPADDWLTHLRASLTPCEVNQVRLACRIAARAFRRGKQAIVAGRTEIDVAAAFRVGLSALPSDGSIIRADGFTFCMAGPHAADASAAYQLSRDAPISSDALVLVHCNSYADGYWTDITRTYCLGDPDARKRELYDAVFCARDAALRAIGPGVRAAQVDHAARDVFRRRGLEGAFRHATGHGVGLAAVDHHARPRLHPKSPDVLETGMVFNVEPAVYFDNYGGIRHCDMVEVTDGGAEVLTPFDTGLDEVTIGPTGR